MKGNPDKKNGSILLEPEETSVRMQNPGISKKLKLWPLFFFLTLLEGIIAFLRLILIPREIESGILFGFSRTRLAILAMLLVVIAVLGVLVWSSLRRPAWCDRWLNPSQKPRLHAWLHRGSAAGMLAAGWALFWLRYSDPERLMALFQRAQPPLVFLLLLFMQLGLVLLFLRNPTRLDKILARREVYSSGLVILLIFLAIAILVALTGIGITPDTEVWGEPGVPLLTWQTVLALLCGWLILMIGLSDWIAAHGKAFDLIMGILLWGLAFHLWMQVPLTVLGNSYYAPIHLPYTVPFPYSDAGLYDYFAQTLLLGNGFGDLIPPRPLYIVFLAGLHALFGTGYAETVLGQTLVLALFPVVLFFLGKRLHSRAAGVTVGMLAIFRELTTLWVSSETRVSNSKLLLSDLPTALAAAAFLLVAVHWLSKKEKHPFDAILPGGLFGLLLLLRTQIAFTLAGLVLAGLLIKNCTWRQRLIQAGLFTASMMLAIAPWVVRNQVAAGSPTLDDPAQMRMVASLYASGSPDYYQGEFLEMTPAEVSETVMEVILEQPGQVAYFVSANFLANEIDTLLVLPLMEEFDGLHERIRPTWVKWDGTLSWQDATILGLYLVLISIGVGASWKHLKWAGLLPLLFNVFYALSNGVSRISGWRYILPMDWVGYFYFGLGVIELIAGAALIFGGQPGRLFTDPQTDLKPGAKRTARNLAWRAGITVFFILLIGSLPVMLENIIPPHFQDQTAEEQTAVFTASPSIQEAGIDEAQIQTFIDQPDALLVTGRLLYPRFYAKQRGIASGHPWPAYINRDYHRMGFLLLTRQGVFHAVLPVEVIPEYFPPDQDVIVVSCQRGDHLEVRMLLFLEEDLLFRSESFSEPCDTD